MADNFLNNQEVTAEDLNNIAVDLGYADYSHFPEDPPQSAVSALNQITADLTSAGVLQIGNKCTVSISDNTIVVQDGVCVFGNGAKKRIEGTLTVDFIEGGTNYVYLFNNVSGNVIQLVNSLTAPTSGDYVMLAEIDADKTVRNIRTFSRAKVSSLGNSEVVNKQFTILNNETPVYCAISGSSSTSSWDNKYIVDTALSKDALEEQGYNYIRGNYYICATVEDIDISKYSYVICFSPRNGEGDAYSRRGNAVYDLKRDYFVFSSRTSDGDGITYCNTSYSGFSNYDGAYFKIIDGKFTMLQVGSSDAPDFGEYTLLFV